MHLHHDCTLTATHSIGDTIAALYDEHMVRSGSAPDDTLVVAWDSQSALVSVQCSLQDALHACDPFGSDESPNMRGVLACVSPLVTLGDVNTLLCGLETTE